MSEQNPPDETPPADADLSKPAKKPQRSFLHELPFLLALALLLTLTLRVFVVQAFYIPSNSMEQTLMVGDRVLVNKVPYRFRDPHRGEIVVFNGLDNFDEGVQFAEPTNPISKVLHKISGAIGFGAPNEKDYIKRVIGVAGDRVMCCDDKDRVVITPKAGKPFSAVEPYIFENETSGLRYFCEAVAKGEPASAATCPPGAVGILVPEGRLWVMGDHRVASADSRAHITDPNSGTVPVDKVIGKAVAVVYPLGNWGLLRVPDTFDSLSLPATSVALGLVGALPVTLLRRRRRRRHR